MRFLFLTLIVLFPSSIWTQSVTNSWMLSNSLGVGFGERRLIAQEHINFSWNSITVGIFARWSGRKHWRDVNFSPDVTYDEYKFNNEFAFLAGWKWDNGKRNAYFLTAGPLYRNENARWWPQKGSGTAPLIGRLLDDVNSDDVKSFGGLITAECIFLNSKHMAGGSLLVFCSFGNNRVDAGLTLNFFIWRGRAIYAKEN